MKCTEEMKLWLFDLAHGNLAKDEEIIKGFIKHYALKGRTVKNVQDDIMFHTNYGPEGAYVALATLNDTLKRYIEER